MKVALLTTDSREHFKDYSNPQPYFGAAPEALLEGFRRMPDAIEVHVVSCLQQSPVSSPETLADNIHYHPLVVSKLGWMRTGYQGCVRAVRRKLRELKPDIVHGQGTERECAISAALSGFPSVVTVHGVMRAIHELGGEHRNGYYWLAKHFESFSLGRIGGVISISPYVDSLVAPLTPKTWFIPNALQEFFFTRSSRPKRRNGPARIVNVGVISPRKRQLELLAELGDLRDDSPFEATFVGRTTPADPYAADFHSLRRKLETPHHKFSHIETLPSEAFLELYDDSDAMIHFSSEESFGLTFAEALARNLVLFASDVGAIGQIGEGLPNCRIFDPQDFAGLRSNLREWLLTNRHLEPREAAPNRLIAERYHPEVIAARHLGVYREVANLTS
jgi:glycosyltransferase involved in cell wall biosynthesis